ncbi:MAG: hypothetical protein ACHQ1D_05480 [Nitrososphaerales archaeon]
MHNTIVLGVTLFSISFCILNIESIYAQNIENWQTFTDPAKRFILFYPPDLEIKGRENFLSSVDVTLGNQNFNTGFKITVMYNDDDKSLLDHVKGLGISAENYLLAVEEQLKPSYQVYNVGTKFLRSENLYGFPTVSNTVDYTNYLGESGRTKNVLAIVNAKGSFLLSYSNSLEAYNGYLPTVNQIIKSIVILK